MTALALWIVRIVILIVIVRLIIRGVTAMMRAGAEDRRAQMPERAAGTLVRDPHCGTYVPESRAIVAGHGTGVHYFCSTACRDAWTAAQARARAGARR